MRKALLGWLGILAWVTAYDVWAMTTGNPTLSSGFWRAVRHPRWKFVVVPAWAALTTHLFFGMP